jgi:hypothetical protein
MELAIKGYDAGSTPAHQIANLRACSSASRMLRGRQSWSFEFSLMVFEIKRSGVVAFNFQRPSGGLIRRC